MKPFMFLLFAIFSNYVFAQKDCKKYVQDPRNPNTEMIVPCDCPKKQEDCKCYYGDWNNEYYSNHHNLSEKYNFGSVCIGSKYITWKWDYWNIDSTSTITNEWDTVTKYVISRVVGSFWHIPKSRVDGFDAEKWKLQSYVEQVIAGRDTIIDDRKVAVKYIYFIKRADTISIDDRYSGPDAPLRNYVNSVVKFPNDLSGLRNNKCFFLTGYKYNEYIRYKDREMEAQNYVEDWDNDKLIDYKAKTTK